MKMRDAVCADEQQVGLVAVLVVHLHQRPRTEHHSEPALLGVQAKQRVEKAEDEFVGNACGHLDDGLAVDEVAFEPVGERPEVTSIRRLVAHVD